MQGNVEQEALTWELFRSQRPELKTKPVPMPPWDNRVWIVRAMSLAEIAALEWRTRKQDTGTRNERMYQAWKLIYGTWKPIFPGTKWNEARHRLDVTDAGKAAEEALAILDDPAMQPYMQPVWTAINELTPSIDQQLNALAVAILSDRVTFAIWAAAAKSGKLWELLDCQSESEQERILETLSPIMAYMQAEGVLQEWGITPERWVMTPEMRDQNRKLKEEMARG